jgi:uncharacterized protein YutE (UPF0331/DUF86 family)
LPSAGFKKVVDRPKLDQILSNLKEYVGVLRTLAAVPQDEFLGNPDKVGNAKYHFVIAIECCIDVANHVIASENYRFPRDNADSFVVLSEHRVLDPIFAKQLGGMARFRNRLIHLYSEIDDRRVFQYLQESLRDLERFAKTIASHPW